jgi:hypothetical protein
MFPESGPIGIGTFSGPGVVELPFKPRHQRVNESAHPVCGYTCRGEVRSLPVLFGGEHVTKINSVPQVQPEQLGFCAVSRLCCSCLIVTRPPWSGGRIIGAVETSLVRF